MNSMEKAEKIKRLWDKLRAHVRLIQFVHRTQKQMDREFLSQFAQ
jgi:hypothetical protein